MAKESAWKTMHDVAVILFEQGIIPDPAMVKKVVLTVSTEEATTVDVTMLVRPDATDKALKQIVRSYELVELETRKEAEQDGEGHRA